MARKKSKNKDNFTGEEKMNIKVPKGMNSPTVVIVGQGTMKPEKNDMTIRRMDNLERKLDQQYQNFYKKNSKPNTDYSALLKTFSSKVGSLEKAIKKLGDKDNSNDDLISAFEKIISRLAKNNKEITQSPVNYNKFMARISSLENVIRELPTQRVSINTSGLTNSFNKLFERLEKTIMKARPRVFPSPS